MRCSCSYSLVGSYFFGVDTLAGPIIQRPVSDDPARLVAAKLKTTNIQRKGPCELSSHGHVFYGSDELTISVNRNHWC